MRNAMRRRGERVKRVRSGGIEKSLLRDEERWAYINLIHRLSGSRERNIYHKMPDGSACT